MTPELIRDVQRIHDDVCTWRPGAVLIEQGAASDALHIVLDGELEVWSTEADRTSWYDTVRAGGVVGEVALLDPGPATATVRSPNGCATLRIGHDELRRLWIDHPAVASALHAQLVRTIAGRLREMTWEVAP
jgi:hypothetical protein